MSCSFCSAPEQFHTGVAAPTVLFDWCKSHNCIEVEWDGDLDGPSDRKAEINCSLMKQTKQTKTETNKKREKQQQQQQKTSVCHHTRKRIS